MSDPPDGSPPHPTARLPSVRLHGDVGGRGPRVGAVVSAGGDVVGELGGGGGACVGGGQGGLAYLVLSLVEQDVGGAGLQGRGHTHTHVSRYKRRRFDGCERRGRSQSDTY